jgi:hypothetical protein
VIVVAHVGAFCGRASTPDTDCNGEIIDLARSIEGVNAIVSGHTHSLVNTRVGPVAIVQATADSLVKLLIAAPLIGGVFLVALVVGAEPVELMSLEWRQLATTIASTLLVRPAVLAAWVAALAVVLVGGSLFVFLVKGGTVGVLVRGERHAGAIERPPLMPETLARASAFSIDTFIDCARGLFPRYARLGAALMTVYLLSGSIYFVLLARIASSGWGLAALLTVAFVAWITVVNLFYLLTQIVVAADAWRASFFQRTQQLRHRSGERVGKPDSVPARLMP